MNIPKEAAVEALNNLETLMDNLDFVGCTTDEEYSFFPRSDSYSQRIC